jgi:hypothetical protein
MALSLVHGNGCEELMLTLCCSVSGLGVFSLDYKIESLEVRVPDHKCTTLDHLPRGNLPKDNREQIENLVNERCSQ